jgi:polar amino acid transport system substrate-binding protein
LKEVVAMRHIAICILLALLTISLAPHLSVASEKYDLVYITEESPPENYTENGKLKGLAVELLQRIWDRLGTPHKEIQVLPWARGYQEVSKTPNTVLFAMTRLDEREKLFKWVGPIRTTRFALVARKSARHKIKTLNDAKKLRIGTVINDGTELLLLERGFAKESLDRGTGLKSAMQKLQLGRIDLLAYGDQNLKYFMSTNGYDPKEYEVVYTLAKSADYYAFHKDTPQKVINAFQGALDAVKKEEFFRELLTKYNSTGL